MVVILNFQHMVRLVFLFILILLCPNLNAQTKQSIPDIIELVKLFIKQEITLQDTEKLEINIGQLNPNLKLKPCEDPLEPYYPSTTKPQHTTLIGVRCPTDSAWSVYVPVKIAIMAPVVVTTRTIARNQIIESSDLTVAYLDKNKLSQGYFTKNDEIIGSYIKRRLPAHTPITPNLLKKPELIKRGQIVTIETQTNLLFIRTQGIALANGTAGIYIKVKNRSSGKIIDALVVAPGKVKVTL